MNEAQRSQIQTQIIISLLNKKQLEIFQDPNRYKILVAGRRSSKSWGLAADLIIAALSRPNAMCKYLALTDDSARDIVLPYIKHINKSAHIKVKYKYSPLEVIYPNGSKIQIKGCQNVKTAETKRGVAPDLVALDEAGTDFFLNNLDYIIEEAIMPSLEDNQGSLIVAGTPNRSCYGWLYEKYKNPGKWSYYSFSIEDNEKFPLWSGQKNWKDTYSRWWKDFLESTGLSEDDPKIQREWKAQWVRDQETVTLPNIENSIVTSLPWDATDTYTDHSIGIDVGQDCFSIIVLQFNRKFNYCVVVDHYHEEKMIYEDMTNKIKEFRNKYKPINTVIDPSPGAQIINDFKKQYSVYLDGAQKRDKVHFVQMLGEDIKNGKVKFLPHLQYLVDNLKQLRWINKREKRIIVGAPLHFLDSLLYAWRSSLHILNPVVPPTPLKEDELHWKIKREEIKRRKLKNDKRLLGKKRHNF